MMIIIKKNYVGKVYFIIFSRDPLFLSYVSSKEAVRSVCDES
jgi:hypothetical protein